MQINYFYTVKKLPLKVLFWIIGLALFCGCNSSSSSNIVVISTVAGDMEVELFADKAPQTVRAFLSYVDRGIYKKSAFYRVLSRDNQLTGANASELIQGGIYNTDFNRDTLTGIPHEPTSVTGLSHTHGTISMAREAPGTATTEFFICIGENTSFDAGGKSNPDGLGYAAFGRVVKGLNILVNIYDRPEFDQSFTPPVTIKNIYRK